MFDTVNCLLSSLNGSRSIFICLSSFLTRLFQLHRHTQTHKHRKNFEPSGIDVFKYNSLNVGSMSKIVIGRDAVGTGWKLIKVIVENTAIGELKTFVANR